jgi:hypothetical protein
MQEMRTMSLAEKTDLILKSMELEDQGKVEEAWKVRRQAPLAPYLAKFHKEHLGLQSLLDSGWNLSDAVAKYGPGFLSE